MENDTLAKLGRSQRILSLLFPIILILANIFLFGPFTIYQGNVNEFHTSLISILQQFLVPSLVILLTLFMIGFILPAKIYTRYTVLLLAFGILTWVQGNILLWDYGILGKGDIDWTNGTWKGLLDTAIWILCFGLALFYHRHVYKIVRSASTALITLQAVLLIVTSIQHPEIWKDKSAEASTPEQLFQLSSKENVIHIILDELQSDVFQNIIQADTGHYYNVFEGFTFYNKIVGSYPTTIMSIPAFLTGHVYQSHTTIQSFVDTVYKGKSIPNVLYDYGYEVDLAAEQPWYGYGKHTNWFYIPVPYGVSRNDLEKANSAHVSGLVLFRNIPHYMKRLLAHRLLDMLTFNLNETESYEALRLLSHKAFLQDLIDNASVGRDKSVYKLIHLTTTHWPAVTNEDCEYAGKVLPWNWKNIKIQAKCSLDHMIQFINKLKSLGIYDSAVIILHADHGYWKIPRSLSEIKLKNMELPLDPDFLNAEDFAEKVCASSPFLAIKLPHSKGPLKISSIEGAISDLPATVNDILDMNEMFSGKSILRIGQDEIRERKFYYYYDLNRATDKYFNRIDEYLIRGDVSDRNSWRFTSMHLPPGMSKIKDRIVFGTSEVVRFLRGGWSYNEMAPDNNGLTYNWAVGKSASLYLSLPKTQVKLTANVKSLFRSGEQLVTVMVDKKQMGSWKNSAHGTWEKHSILIEADNNRPSSSIVEFTFSKYYEPRGEEYRQLALLFESIILE